MIVLAIILSVLAVSIPTLIFVVLLYWLDRNEREPISLLAMAFGWGAFPAIILAVITGLIADIPLSLLGATVAEFASTTAMSPLLEEIAKGLVVLVVYWGFSREFDGPVDGIVYGALVGSGFAMVENLLYVIGAWLEGGWVSWIILVVLRTLVFGLNHAFFSSLTGLGFGLARISRSAAARILFPIAGLATAVFFHAVHNLGASLTDLTWMTVLVSLFSDWGGVLVIFVVILLSLWQEKREMQSAKSQVSGIEQH